MRLPCQFVISRMIHIEDGSCTYQGKKQTESNYQMFRYVFLDLHRFLFQPPNIFIFSEY
jgi:hypothetical protein